MHVIEYNGGKHPGMINFFSPDGKGSVHQCFHYYHISQNILKLLMDNTNFIPQFEGGYNVCVCDCFDSL